MKRFLVACAALALLLPVRGQAAPGMPAVSAVSAVPAVSAVSAVPGVPAVPPALQCESNQASARTRQVALQWYVRQYLKGKQVADVVKEPYGARVGCLAFYRIGHGEALAVTGPPAPKAPAPAVFAWQPPGQGWQVAPLSGLTDPFVAGGDVVFDKGKPDLFLIATPGGSGGFHELLHGRPDWQGGIDLMPAAKAEGHDRYDFLGHDLVLHTYRGPAPGPMAWTCNACLPVNHQRLLRWNGQALTREGERIFSTPDLTANLLVGALQAGKPDLAASYFISPSLIRQVAEVLGPHPSAWRDVEDTSPNSLRWRIRDAELFNWNLIPVPYRKKLPPDLNTYRFPLERGQDLISLRMVRQPQGWMVSGLKL